MTTDTSERGLEDLICAAMTGVASLSSLPVEGSHFPSESYGGAGWLLGDPRDYDREYCVDLVHLRDFLTATQPETAKALELERDTPVRRRFLARLEKECGKRGVIDLLRNGVKHEKYSLDLFYGAPSPGNDKAALRSADGGGSFQGDTGNHRHGQLPGREAICHEYCPGRRGCRD